MGLALLVTSAWLRAEEPASAPPTAPELRAAERWYTVSLDGVRAGWCMYALRPRAGGGRTWAAAMELSITRMGTSARLRTSAEFSESADGAAIEMSSTHELSADKAVTRCTFRPDGVDVVTESAAGKQSERVPLPEGEWLTPAGVADLLLRRAAEGVDTIEYRTIDPSNGPEPYSVKARRLGPTTIKLDGAPVTGIAWETEQSITPGLIVKDVLDAEGWPLRSETTLIGMSMVLERVPSKERALAPGGSAELMAPQLVKPNRPLPGAHQNRRAVYTVRAVRGPSPALPSTGAQRAEPLAPGDAGLRVTVDLDGSILETLAPDDRAIALRATSLINGDEECIRRLVATALENVGAGELERARALRRAAHEHMEHLGLAVGFAGSAEVCRDRAGDCTEHAVLLAAMLRSNGIPARVASGLVYCESLGDARDIFGPHMWTQAYISDLGKGRGGWLDLDATLATELDYSAGHILFSTATLRDGGLTSEMAQVAALLGGLTVEIIEPR